MKGILKTLVLLAVPICLVGMMGCGQNLQASLGNISGISQDEKTILETSGDAEPSVSTTEPSVSTDEDRDMQGLSGYECADVQTATGGPSNELWKELVSSDPTKAIVRVIDPGYSFWYHFELEVCSCAVVPHLKELRDAYKSKCAGYFLNTMNGLLDCGC